MFYDRSEICIQNGIEFECMRIRSYAAGSLFRWEKKFKLWLWSFPGVILKELQGKLTAYGCKLTIRIGILTLNRPSSVLVDMYLCSAEEPEARAL